MLHTRVIPCLLLHNGDLVKTIKFKNPIYIGDPINAVRIFNDKEVDELVFLDISATPMDREPNYELIGDIASEAFMPFGYGGGITNVKHIKRLYGLGVEKVIINSAAVSFPNLISEAASIAGSSGVITSVDVHRNILGKYSVYIQCGKKKTDLDIIQYVQDAERLGTGEIILNSMNNEGTMGGYDLNLIKQVSEAVSIPVVAVGGAGNLLHFRQGVDAGASAVGAGSMFVFHGKHRAILITYPDYEQLESLFK